MVTWSGVEEIARSSSVSNASNSFKLEKKMSEIHVDADRGLRSVAIDVLMDQLCQLKFK